MFLFNFACCVGFLSFIIRNTRKWNKSEYSSSSGSFFYFVCIKNRSVQSSRFVNCCCHLFVWIFSHNCMLFMCFQAVVCCKELVLYRNRPRCSIWFGECCELHTQIQILYSYSVAYFADNPINSEAVSIHRFIRWTKKLRQLTFLLFCLPTNRFLSFLLIKCKFKHVFTS